MNQSTEKPPSTNAKPVARKLGLARILGIFDYKVTFGKNIHEVAKKLVLGLSLTDEHIRRIVGKIITSALSASDKTVRDIMVLRSSVVAVEPGQNLKEVVETVVSSGHSRFPVIDKENNIIGIIYSKDLLVHFSNDKQVVQAPLQDNIFRECPIIPQSKSIMVLLDEFRTKKIHMAAVVDEYGNFEGIVTIEDVLEELVGEIQDEHDKAEKPLFLTAADGSHICNSQTALSDFNKTFPQVISDYSAETIGGAITEEIGRVPQVGEKIIVASWLFTILRANEKVIEKVKFTLLENINSSKKSN